LKIVSALVWLSCAQFAYAESHSPLEQIQVMHLAGDYQSAIDLARSGLEADSNNAQLLSELGNLLFETGKLAAATVRFQQIIDLPDSDKPMAKLNLANIHRHSGELQLADSLYTEIRDGYQTLPQLSARDLFAIASATRNLGRSDPQLFKEAVQLFVQASRKNPSFLDAKIALGELLLEKYNNEEAAEVFGEVLSKNQKHPRALLGLARSQHFDYSSAAMLTVQQALEINPRLVSARVFMARLYIELEQYNQAKIEAQKALDVNPVSLEALSMLAVVHHLERNTIEFARIENQVLGLNPRYADFYTSLADLAAQNRLYRDALDFAQTAVKLDHQSWRAYGLMGMNQMRLGKMQQGQVSLERSFEGDPFNIWTKNTLQLADSFNNYVQIDRDNFQIVLHASENELLAEYIQELAKESYQQLKTRYRHEPDKPIRLELYPDHADFSVRTVGLAGVGLLGVCFGPVVAMDSPAARKKGAFNWGSTMWHEIAHVFHLSMTDNRVPRWFSEGLAVYEERIARPGWGGDVSPDFLLAYLGGGLLPVSQLNNGFVRPSYPEQVVFSYFQASLVFEFIETRWGFDVIRDTLNAFRDSKNPDAELLQRLQLDAKALDTAFDTFLQNKYATALKALSEEPEPGQQAPPPIKADQLTRDTRVPDKYFDQLKMGILLLEQGKLDLAELFLEKAQQLFPEYAGGDSSYWLLAAVYSRQGKHEQAEQQLSSMTAINGEHYDAHWQLAKLRANRGDHAGAAAALDAAIYIFPYDLELHATLARHEASVGAWDRVTRERRALLALDPVDRAEAHYQLAIAYDAAGNRNSAHEQILYALEIAPNFLRAQELLLSLRKTRPATAEQQ
jgi:tetratricopeptide (TPR) repeat protein